MEKKNRRIITFLIGIYLWTLYIFQNEMADYGMYTVISYRMHEVASVIPFLCIGVTIIWFAYLLLRIMKKQVDKSDKVFIIILLGLVLLQGNYIRQMSSQWTTTAFVKIERIDETQGIIVVSKDRTGQEITLESPMLVNNLLETEGQKYWITYSWSEGNPCEGKLQMIQKSGEPSTIY